jgi:pyridoxal phosphate-dependent aminotransferase EpsN
MPEFAGSRGNRWLTCMTIDPAQSDVAPADVLAAMAADNIEGRPLWKPLHCQPLYAGVETFGGRVAEELFARGLCLPSGSAMSEQELDRVVGAVRGAFRAN